MTDRFVRWMQESEESYADPAEARAGFEALLHLARSAEIDLLRPGRVQDIVELLLAAGPVGLDLLALFHDYLRFRLAGESGADWEDAHDELESLLEPDDAFSEVLLEAVEADAQLDPQERRVALAEVRVVAQVQALLEFIGSGRAVTDSGALRRADIGPVAALLGVSARGVAKLPLDAARIDGVDVVDGEAQVQSMWGLPTLATWWEALLTANLIEVTASRVRPGPAAKAWLADELPPLDQSVALVGVYI